MITQFYNTLTGQVEQEKVLGDSMLRLAYCNCVGRVMLWPLFKTAIASRIMGHYANSPSSKKRIGKTIADLGIDMNDFVVPEGGFSCFNDFFYRKLKPGARIFEEGGFCSPADCRITCYQQLQEDTCIPVKGRAFTVAELLGEQGAKYAELFKGGSLAVLRLCPADYHRYHYPDNGTTLDHWRIEGNYHSVHPLALMQNIRVFTQNEREISILDLEHYGKCAYIEVGAFGVGTICQTHTHPTFNRGDEKGYFAFGGSTIIIIFQPNKISFKQDLLSHLPMESLIRAGYHINN